MGRRGPPPKPTALKKLSGSWRANVDNNEPVAPEGIPVPPDFLNDEAVRYWKRLVPMLQDMELLTLADGDMLALYCQSLARLAECERVINEEGPTYKTYTATGELSMIKLRPEARLSKELTATVNRLGKEFGLSPSARTYLNVVPNNGKRDEGLSQKEQLFA